MKCFDAPSLRRLASLCTWLRSFDVVSLQEALLWWRLAYLCSLCKTVSFFLRHGIWHHFAQWTQIIVITAAIPASSQHQNYFCMFWKKLYCSDSAVLQSLSSRMHQTFVAVGSLYNVLSPKLSNNSVRELIWNSFAMSVDLWFTSYYFCVFLCF